MDIKQSIKKRGEKKQGVNTLKNQDAISSQKSLV